MSGNVMDESEYNEVSSNLSHHELRILQKIHQVEREHSNRLHLNDIEKVATYTSGQEKERLLNASESVVSKGLAKKHSQNVVELTKKGRAFFAADREFGWK